MISIMPEIYRRKSSLFRVVRRKTEIYKYTLIKLTDAEN